MNIEQKRENSSGEEDSWKGLAEDLFGIDFGRSRAGAKSETDESQHPSKPTPIETEDDQSHSAPAVAATQTNLHAEALEQSTANSTDKMATDEFEVVKTDSTSNRHSEDTFWEVLEDWDSNNSTRMAKKSSGKTDLIEKSELAEIEQATSTTPEQPTTSLYRRDALIDDNFGFGILDDEAKPEATDAEVDADNLARPVKDEAPKGEEKFQASSEENVSEPNVKKRRRRRRRGRSPKSKESIDGERPEPELLRSKVNVTEESNEVAIVSVETVSDKPPEPQRKRSSRRRRESKMPTDAADQAATEEPAIQSTDQVIADEPSDAETRRPATVTYRDLPTWKEAIAFLLDPNLVTAKSSEPETAKGDVDKNKPTNLPKSSGRRSRRRR